LPTAGSTSGAPRRPPRRLRASLPEPLPALLALGIGAR
jgi:hypothetical protein